MAEQNSPRESARGANVAGSPLKEQAHSYLSPHRRIARDSARRLWQQPVSSMMTWLVMGIALALPVGLLLLLTSLQGVSAGWESSARITLYLSDDTSLERAGEIRSELSSDSRIESVNLIDRDQALAEFRANSGLQDALDYLDENPLPHTLLVTPEDSARTAQGVETLVQYFGAQEGVDRVQVDLGWLQRLNAMTDLLARAAWVLALLLAAAVVLVIGNTIRLAIENRRDEILVAKLVGGTDAFVRRPFLYTGAWYGLGGGIAAWLMLQIAVWWLSGPVERLASLYRSQFSLQGLGFDAILALIITAMLLGWLGAWLAVKRHLDDIDPGEIAGG